METERIKDPWSQYKIHVNYLSSLYTTLGQELVNSEVLDVCLDIFLLLKVQMIWGLYN